MGTWEWLISFPSKPETGRNVRDSIFTYPPNFILRTLEVTKTSESKIIPGKLNSDLCVQTLMKNRQEHPRGNLLQPGLTFLLAFQKKGVE